MMRRGKGEEENQVDEERGGGERESMETDRQIERKNKQRQIQTDGEVTDTDRRSLRQIQTDEKERDRLLDRERGGMWRRKKDYTVNEML